MPRMLPRLRAGAHLRFPVLARLAFLLFSFLVAFICIVPSDASPCWLFLSVFLPLTIPNDVSMRVSSVAVQLLLA